MHFGSIPDKVIYMYAGTKTVKTKFEDSECCIKEIEVVPTFPFPSDNKGRRETATRWVKGSRGYGSKADEKKVEPMEIEIDNTGSTITVIGIEHRAEGGLAYKVVDDQGHYFDLRTDSLLDAIINGGIKDGGIIKGKMIWCVVGSHMKLVRIGSDLHKDMVEATKLGKMKKISLKALKLGHKYKTKTGQTGVYCGMVLYKSKKVRLWFMPEDWKEISFNSFRATNSHNYIEDCGFELQIEDDFLETAAKATQAAIEKRMAEHAAHRAKMSSSYWGQRWLTGPYYESESAMRNRYENTIISKVTKI